MKTNYVKEEMQVLIESMNEQFEMMQEHDLHIPQIELDIFMRNIQKLYESTIYLNKLNAREDIKTSAPTHIVEEKADEIVDGQPKEAQMNTTEEPIHESPQIVEHKIVVESTQAIEVSNEEEVIEEKFIDSKENEEVDISFETIKDEEENLFIVNDQNKEIADQRSEVKISDELFAFDDLLEDKKEETDLFSSVKTTNEISDLNKKLAEARNTQSIVEKLQTKRIDSLKSVIGINDKFYFINELFAGDTQKYEAIIYTLNNFKKLEDAMVYFSTLKYKFGWDEEAEAYIKLTQMLERKFEMEHA